MATYKRKQWLLEKGHIKESQAGRGRISYENKVILQKAKDEGVVFSDWPNGEVISLDTADSTVKVEKPKTESSEKVWFDVVYRYPIDQWEAVSDSNVVYSVKEACNNCGLSLCAHRCNSPSVLGYPVVMRQKNWTKTKPTG